MRAQKARHATGLANWKGACESLQTQKYSTCVCACAREDSITHSHKLSLLLPLSRLLLPFCSPPYRTLSLSLPRPFSRLSSPDIGASVTREPPLASVTREPPPFAMDASDASDASNLNTRHVPVSDNSRGAAGTAFLLPERERGEGEGEKGKERERERQRESHSFTHNIKLISLSFFLFLSLSLSLSPSLPLSISHTHTHTHKLTYVCRAYPLQCRGY